MLVRIFAIAAFAWATAAYAVDYDYERARADWQRQQSIADNLEDDWEREKRDLIPFQTAFSRAQQLVTQKENQLNNIRSQIRTKEQAIDETEDNIDRLERERDDLVDANRDLQREIDQMHQDHRRLEDVIDDLEDEKRDVERRIRDLQDDPNENDWTCIFVDRGHEEHRGGHPATNAVKSAAQEEAEASCLEFHGECRQHSCTQPENDELERLRQRLAQINSDLNAKRQELRSCEQDIANLERTKQHNENGIASIDRRLPELRSDLRQFANVLRQLRRDESDTEIALSRARGDLADARSALNRQQLAVDRAEDEYNSAQRRADDAEDYYQEVLANYNNAMTAARNHGTTTGNNDGGREARERAADPAATTGASHARRDGQAAGAAEAAAISHARGYRFGRDNASNISSYSTGYADGEDIARDKARGENFPRGYNEALLSDLAQQPGNVETLDITDSLPSLPDGGGQLLSTDQKSIRTVEEPAYGYEQEPAFQPPEPNTQSVRAPSPDRRYYSPDCSSQPLEAFAIACREEYESTYVGRFAGIYSSAYNIQYKTVYRSTIPDVYRDARNQQNTTAYETGKRLGAGHQGILDGFSATLAGARQTAHQQGQQAYATYEQTGFIPLLRAVALDEDYEDDNLSPGEAIKLKITVDNFGELASSTAALTIAIEDLSGGQFSLETRTLPVLQADTTTHLEGVLKGQVGAQDGETLTFKVSLLSTSGTVLDEAIFSGTVQSPIVLSRVTFGGPVTIGEEVEGTLHIANRTGRTTDSSSAALSVSPAILDLLDGDLTLPSIPSEGSVEVPFGFIADARAGGNLAVKFQLQVEDIAGAEAVQLAHSTPVAVNRNGSLALCLPQCGAPVSLPLRVRAGSTLRIPTEFDFHATTRQRGPFILGKAEVSDPRIRGANGSTVSANLGSWGPGNSVYRANFAYVIPSELRGQTHWVSLYLDDGGTRIHLVEVPFVVE